MRHRQTATSVALALCSLLGLLGVVGAEPDGLVIVKDRQPRATIVVAQEANEKVKLAAAELQTYIEKMSGAKLPVAEDTTDPQGALILVGRSKFTDEMGVAIPSGLTNARREEGFVIHCEEDRLVLAGNDEGPYHGSEYAVYDFLERLGVRWFMPGDFGEIVPQRATIAFGAIHVHQEPDFIMRDWWLHTTPELAEQERRWKIRNKMNPSRPFAVPTDSSARRILPESEYFQDHPEYFAMNPDGSRNPHLPNLTNPKAVEIAAEIIKAYFREHPAANSYGFAPDDGFPRDYNPETLQLNRGIVTVGGRPGVPGEVSTTEEWTNFVNQVTAEVHQEFPDVYIATNGYANRNNPPEGVELDDHLIIMFAAIWSCTIHAYDDPHCWQKVRQGQMLKRWCELCDNVWIYGYNYQMLVSALTPLPEVHKLRHDFPLMKKWGVMGFLDETRNVWAECGIISRYLRARLEWDAHADVDAILDDFYRRWYGRATEPAQAFWDALERSIQSTPVHGHEDRILRELYTPELMAALREHLTGAEKLTDSDRTRLHVRVDRLIYDHLKAYMGMSAAEAAGNFAQAARQARRMLRRRQELHEISPFLMWPDETRYISGLWYWGVSDRQEYYQSLADMTSGKTGDLVALLPETAMFRTDPHNDGLFAQWYQPDLSDRGWRPVQTTRPFYVQGHLDDQGHPYVGNIWYRLKVDVPTRARGRRVLLYAPTIETEAWCWVNGQYVGHRPYREAYVRPAKMEFDVTEVLRPGEINQITIQVSTGLALAQAAAGLQSRLFLYSPQGAPATLSP